MARIYNVYCDESCHLERDGHPIMLIGGIRCPLSKVQEISLSIREIKERHKARGEIKWTKVSSSRIEFFKNIIDYFFSNKDLHFRCLIVNDKSRLNHSAFNQGSHETFYYKMYYSMLKIILDPVNVYNIYVDIKDTRSHQRVDKLKEVLCNNFYDFTGDMIRKIQQIRSEESEIMQIADLLIGAVGYLNRELSTNAAKMEIINHIQSKSRLTLRNKTSLYNRKFNLFFFTPSLPGGECA